MNIDDIKSNWQSLNIVPSTSYCCEMEHRAARNSIPTLCNRYFALNMRLIAVCCLGILTFIPFASISPLLVYLSIIYFAIMGVMMAHQAISVRKINLSRMSVMEAINAVCCIERQRIVKRAVGLCMAIPLLLYFAVLIHEDFGDVMLYGCIAGGIVGIVLGIIINRKASRILSEMKAQLGE
ncbi:MAG: hypothetical protein NC339_01775 [Muribaculaceae bacterium]|nr:hypothetical protein [Muribaculaceae bacterium]